MPGLSYYNINIHKAKRLREKDREKERVIERFIRERETHRKRKKKDFAKRQQLKRGLSMTTNR